MTNTIFRGEGRIDKQNGGKGQKAACTLEVSARPRGAGFEFKDCTVGGPIPKQFVSSIQKGVVDAMQCGPLAGYPIVDLQVNLIDGETHEVDSSDYAFREAGRLALQDACSAFNMLLLEPMADLEVITPQKRSRGLSRL